MMYLTVNGTYRNILNPHANFLFLFINFTEMEVLSWSLQCITTLK